MSDHGQPYDPAAPGGEPAPGLPPLPGQYVPVEGDPVAPPPYDPTQYAPPPYDPTQYTPPPYDPTQYAPTTPGAYGAVPDPYRPTEALPPFPPAPPTGPGGGPGGPGGPGGSGGRRRRGLLAAAGVVVALVAAVVAYLLVSGGGAAGASTPAKAVDRLLAAGKKLDEKQMKAALCKADRAAPRIGGSPITVGDRVTSYSVGETTRTGDARASVRATVSTQADPEPQSVDFPVVKEDGGWKVCLTDLIGDLPAELPAPSDVTTPATTPSSSPSSTSPGAQESPSSSATGGVLPSAPRSLPRSFPTDIFPSELPSGMAFCASSNDALTPAQAYLGAAEVGLPAIAQTCVYQDSVPRSVAERLSGRLYVPDGEDRTGGGGKGPRGVYVFRSVEDDTSTVTITTTKKSDGRYYVTDVRVS